MKLEMVTFQGVEVGFILRAEREEDQHLLWSLRGLKVEVSETFGSQLPHMLAVRPNLPWENQNKT